MLSNLETFDILKSCNIPNDKIYYDYVTLEQWQYMFSIGLIGEDKYYNSIQDEIGEEEEEEDEEEEEEEEDEEEDNKPNLKVILCGYGGVGKTTLVNKILYNEFTSKYIPTMGVKVNPIEINDHVYNIWDTAGQDKFGGLKDGYYVCADKAFIMCNPDSKATINKIKEYYNNIRDICPDIKITLIINKIMNKNKDRLVSRYYNKIKQIAEELEMETVTVNIKEDDFKDLRGIIYL